MNNLPSLHYGETHLVVDGDVVLCRHVVSYVVIKDKTQQPVQQRQVNLLVQLVEACLQHHIALSLRRIPDIGHVIDAYTSAR